VVTVVFLAWIVSRVDLFIAWRVQGGFADKGLVEDLKITSEFLSPLSQMFFVGFLAWICSLAQRRTLTLGLSMGGLTIACAVFAADWIGIGRNEGTYPRSRAFVQHYLKENYHGPSTPTIYWPFGLDPKPIWFDLGVNCYFEWHQLDGNVYNRENALEGRRRARLLQRFEVARMRHLFGEDPDPVRRFWMERKVEAQSRLEPPSQEDLRRLCEEPDLDYVVLRQAFDTASGIHLYAGSDGEWFLYDCQKLRSATALGALNTAINVENAEKRGD
jgi:hypothetical protein